jgi:hypothetical protein
MNSYPIQKKSIMAKAGFPFGTPKKQKKKNVATWRDRPRISVTNTPLVGIRPPPSIEWEKD